MRQVTRPQHQPDNAAKLILTLESIDLRHMHFKLCVVMFPVSRPMKKFMAGIGPGILLYRMQPLPPTSQTLGY